MKRGIRSFFPALLLAAGVLGSTALSLRWPVAGLMVMAVTIIVAGAFKLPAMILGAAVGVAGALLIFIDVSSVPMMIPILGACGIGALAPKNRVEGQQCSQS